MSAHVCRLSILCLCLSLVSCVLIGSSASSLVTVKRTQMHMGTLVSITAVGRSHDEANDAITAGFQEIKRLEQLLSTWISSSELSKVNAAAGQSAVKVSLEAMAVVRKSLQVAEMTEGAFNIAIGPAVRAMPENWHWPERIAANIVRMDQEAAGARLIAIAAPDRWRDIVLGYRIVSDNRDAIAQCKKASTNKRESVRCPIEIKTEAVRSAR